MAFNLVSAEQIKAVNLDDPDLSEDGGGSGATIKVDTAANLTKENPVLLKGQLGAESDTTYMKLGDGTTAWNDLKYIKANKSVQDAAGNVIADTYAKKTDINNKFYISADSFDNQKHFFDSCTDSDIWFPKGTALFDKTHPSYLIDVSGYVKNDPHEYGSYDREYYTFSINETSFSAEVEIGLNPVRADLHAFEPGGAMSNFFDNHRIRLSGEKSGLGIILPGTSSSIRQNYATNGFLERQYASLSWDIEKATKAFISPYTWNDIYTIYQNGEFIFLEILDLQ